MPELWVPGMAGPHEDFVGRLHRQIERFAQRHDVKQPVVVVELRDGSRFRAVSISPEPGYGFVTIAPHPGEEDLAGELIVAIGGLARIELYVADEAEPAFGFSLPSESASTR